MAMRSNGRLVLALLVCCGLAWAGARAEDAVEPEKKADETKPAAPATTPAARTPGATPGRTGMGRGGGVGGGLGGMGFRGAAGDPNRIVEMVSRQLGSDTPVKTDQLSYGPDRNLVTAVPVGGVDLLQRGARGVKDEDLFTLTDEQQKALNGLRDEYKTEVDKIQKELDASTKALAAKVLDLRQKFELKANEVLTGDARATKEKLDAVAAEYKAKVAAQEKERIDGILAETEKTLKELRGKGDPAAIRDFFRDSLEKARALGAKTEGVTKDAIEKLKTVVTGDVKTKLETALKEADRPRFFGPGGTGGPGGAGGRGGGFRSGAGGGGGAGGTNAPGAGEKPAVQPGDF